MGELGPENTCQPILLRPKVNLSSQVQLVRRKWTLGPIRVGLAQKRGRWVKETITQSNPLVVGLTPIDDKGI